VKTIGRKFSRREILQFIGAGVAATALGSCAPSAEKKAVEPGEPVTLTHWQHHSTSRAQTVEHFKARFEDENEGVTIDFQSIPWAEYWGKLASAIAAGAGSAPDVFQIPMGLVEEYVAGDNILPIDDSILSSSEIEDLYLPWTVQRAKREGKYYGLPLDVQTLLIYRSDALYTEAGLDPKAPFVDHNDLYDQAIKLTKKSGDQTDQIGCDTGYYSAWMTTLFQQFLQREQGGKPWVDPDSNKLVWQDYPEIFAAFEWFCDLSAKADDNAFMTGQSRFALGKAGMMLGHPVSRGSLAAQAPDMVYTIVPFPPRSPGQQLYTAGSHWMWVVSKWVSDPTLAWQWVHYCTNKPAQIVWSDIGGDLPSMKELVDDERFRKNDNAVTVMESLKYASPWEWIGWAEWVKETGDARDRVVIGGESTRSSFDTMVENLNQVVETHTVT
jgi:multiple sugar transport system substrate-binding protein